MESKLIGLKRNRDDAMTHYEGYSEDYMFILPTKLSYCNASML